MSLLPRTSTLGNFQLSQHSSTSTHARTTQQTESLTSERPSAERNTGVRSAKTAAFQPTKSTRRKLTKRDQLMIVTQLSIMLRAGVDLAEAVRSISQRSTSENIRSAMGDVYAQLESGMRLSQAMQENQSLFGGVMVASIAAGEASGRLPEVLGRLSAIIRDEMRLVSSIRGAISYPLVLLCVTALVLSAMIFFVLPQFGTIYASSRAPTPALTQLLLDAATLARGYWYLMLSAVGLIGVALWRFFKSDSGRRQVDQAVFRLPFTNRICSSLMAGRMFRLQGVMLNSGVPMLDVLQLTKYSVGNRCYRDLIDQIEESVVSGRGMSPVLSQSSIVPSGAADMIVTAEANGQLGSVLQTVGEFYESEGEQYLRDAVKIAEPAIIVVVGLIVGSIVLAVMLPMLDLSTANGA